MPRLNNHLFVIEIEPVCPDRELHPEDIEAEVPGVYVVSVPRGEDEPEERALDALHETIPIKVLDHFEITVTEADPADVPGEAQEL